MIILGDILQTLQDSACFDILTDNGELLENINVHQFRGTDMYNILYKFGVTMIRYDRDVERFAIKIDVPSIF